MDRLADEGLAQQPRSMNSGDMMRLTSRWPVARHSAVAAVVLLAACHAPQRLRPEGPELLGAAEHAVDSAPRVRIRAESEIGVSYRIRTRLDLTGDAYVVVFNVGPDGVTQIVFPESPDDAGFLRGNRTYALQPMFTGYPSLSLTSFTGARFRHVRSSSQARPMMRGPGYVFALASPTPFDLHRLAQEGYFDGAEIAHSVYELDPEDVVPAVAEVAMGAGTPASVRADVARYGSYDDVRILPAPGNRYAYSRSAYCTDMGMRFGVAPASSPFDLTYYDGVNCRSARLVLPPRVFPRRVPPEAVPGDSTEADSIPPEPTGIRPRRPLPPALDRQATRSAHDARPSRERTRPVDRTTSRTTRTAKPERPDSKPASPRATPVRPSDTPPRARTAEPSQAKPARPDDPR